MLRNERKHGRIRLDVYYNSTFVTCQVANVTYQVVDLRSADGYTIGG